MAIPDPSKGPTKVSRVGVIDLGSNTVLVLVLELGGRVVLDEARITRLGERLVPGRSLLEEARQRTLEVVRYFARLARETGADPVVVVGTAALRRARDGRAFMAELIQATEACRAHVLSGEEEARFALHPHALHPHGTQLPKPTVTVVDVGGGSTEVAWIQGAAVAASSLPVGTLALTEACVHSDPPTSAEIEALRSAAAEAVRNAPRLGAAARGGSEPVTVAGTATTLAALDLELPIYDPELVEGHGMSRQRLEQWIDRLAPLSVASRRELPGMDPGRADILVAGLILLEAVLRALGAERFRVSGRGVRYGVALRLLEQPDALW